MLASSAIISIFLSLVASITVTQYGTAMPLRSILAKSIHELNLDTRDQLGLEMLATQWSMLPLNQEHWKWAKSVDPYHLDAILEAIKKRPSLIGLGMTLFPIDVVFPLTITESPTESTYIRHLLSLLSSEMAVRHSQDAAPTVIEETSSLIDNVLHANPLPFPVTAEMAEEWMVGILLQS